MGNRCGRTRTESYEVGRWYAALGEQNEAEKVFTSLVNGSDLASERAKLALAYQYKKSKQWERALDLFREIADNPFCDVTIKACIEAAKLLEHKQKKIDLALSYCDKALKAIKHMNLNPNPSFSQELEKRYARLVNKNK